MKTTMLILISCLFCAVSFGQIEGHALANQLLKQENVDTKNMSDVVKLSKAMTILDVQKEKNIISEDQFQSKLNLLMAARTEVNQKMVDERIAQAKKNRENGKKGKPKTMFDLSRERIKKKLDQGKITQVEYDQRMKNIAESEKKKANQ